MSTSRHFDPIEVEELVDLYYILEMKFVVEKMMFPYYERCSFIPSVYIEAV